jgi:hypothetical protein
MALQWTSLCAATEFYRARYRAPDNGRAEQAPSLGHRCAPRLDNQGLEAGPQAAQPIARLLSKLQRQDRFRWRSTYHAVGADSASQKEISASFLSCDARGSTGGR